MHSFKSSMSSRLLVFAICSILPSILFAQDVLLLNRSLIDEKPNSQFSLLQYIRFEEDGIKIDQSRKNIIGCEHCIGRIFIKNTDTLPLNFMINIYYAKVLEFKKDNQISQPAYESKASNLFPVSLLPGKIHEIQFTFAAGEANSIYVYADQPRKYEQMLKRYIPERFDRSSFLKYGFLSVLIFAFLSGIFQFIVRRDLFLIFYAGFALFLTVYFVFHNSSNLYFIYTDPKLTITGFRLLPLLQACYILMYLFFAVHISQMRVLKFQISSLLYKAILWNVAFIVIYLLVWLILGKPISLIADIYRFGFILICTVLFYYTWRNKDSLLNIISLGALIFFISNLILYGIMLSLPFFEQMNESSLILIAGGFFEILIFSIAVAYQTNEINKEKISYLEALNAINQKNQELAERREQELSEKVEEARQQIMRSEQEKMESMLKIQINELEMQALRSQINPHFLFNSLNSLKIFIHTHDKEAALTYIDQFAGLLRRLLENTFEKRVSLASELELMQWYVELENLRMNEKVKLEIQIDPELDPNFTQIPSMILQPFIENAIWHGLAPKEAKEKIISLYIVQSENNNLTIRIEDNGIGLSASQMSKSDQTLRKSMGIQITKQRLDLMCTSDSNIKIKEMVNSDGQTLGTRVQVILPN